MNSPNQRPFNFENVSPENKERMVKIQNAMEAMGNKDMEELSRLGFELYEILKEDEEQQKKKYEKNPPNSNSHYALVKGILFTNETGLRTHDFTPYFSTDSEYAYIWTHTPNNSSSLVVDVDPLVREKNVWRNLGSVLELTVAISSSFEHWIESDYDWIYEFDANKSIEESIFHLKDNYSRLSGSQLQVSYFAERAALIELLIRDERFYVISSNLLNSLANHHFCVVCTYQEDGYQKHPNHELPTWQVAQAIPKMEIAIVQATRAVEAVLGKPGHREKEAKYRRVIKRWMSSIDIDPNENFKIADKNFIDYYYEMFGIRGDAAHSLGKFPFAISRQLTIEAQCFAWEILKSYFRKYALENDKAQEKLNFNMDLIGKEPKDWSTNRTAD